MKKAIILPFLIILFSSIVFSNIGNCGTLGNYTNDGFTWDDACQNTAYVCSSSYVLNNYTENRSGEWVQHIFDIRDKFQIYISAECGESLRANFSIPSKYRNCETTVANFWFKGSDGVAFLKSQNINSIAQVNANLIKDWENNDSGKNCYSSRLQNFGKGYELAHTEYGSDFHNCSGSFLSIYESGINDYSVMLKNSQDGSNILFGTISFWYKETVEDGNPNACNGVDDDCDGQIDEGLKTTYYKDADGDTFGDPNQSRQACSAPTGYVTNNQDCDDTTTTRSPVATENVNNGVDDDCDELIDEGKNRLQNCLGIPPQNAVANYGSTQGQYTETWNGTNWTSDNNTFHHNTIEGECAFICASTYLYNSNNNTCSKDLTEATCLGTKPTNSIWNDGGFNGKYNYAQGEPNNLTTEYNLTVDDCHWKCANDYHYENGECITNSNPLACDLTDQNGVLPPNAKWNNTSTFTQNWNGSAWTPTTKKATYNEIPGECNYSCKEVSKNCTPDKQTYCGIGVQECRSGYWSECIPTQANICTQNQYCNTSTNTCSFCSQGTKNCDSNLLNGCETITNNDVNNCGECGISCGSGENCINGTCSGGDNNLPLIDDPCEDVTCETNQYCYSGSCLCKSGFYNCDNDLTNGCEKFGGCDLEPECENDNDCENEETCENNSCVVEDNSCLINVDCDDGEKCVLGECVIDVRPCADDDDCLPSESCSLGVCEEKSCGPGFQTTDSGCSCAGTTCGNSCYVEYGKCCNGVWNKDLDSCTFDVTNILNIVEGSDDTVALNLINRAQVSIETGNIMKGKTEAMLAKLKVESNTNPSLETIFEEAKAAYDIRDYDTAQGLIIESEDKNNGGFPFEIMLIVIIVVIIGIVVWFKFIRVKEIDEQY